MYGNLWLQLLQLLMSGLFEQFFQAFELIEHLWYTQQKHPGDLPVIMTSSKPLLLDLVTLTLISDHHFNFHFPEEKVAGIWSTLIHAI